jgi:hypothetical protein
MNIGEASEMPKPIMMVVVSIQLNIRKSLI